MILYSPSVTEDEILLDWRIYNTIVNRESFFHLFILSAHYLFGVLSKGTFYFAFSNNLTFSSFFESDRKSSRTNEHERGIVHHDHDFCMSYFCSLDLLSRFKNFEAWVINFTNGVLQKSEVHQLNRCCRFLERRKINSHVYVIELRKSLLPDVI